jgi:hypothetical protein
MTMIRRGLCIQTFYLIRFLETHPLIDTIDCQIYKPDYRLMALIVTTDKVRNNLMT